MRRSGGPGQGREGWGGRSEAVGLRYPTAKGGGRWTLPGVVRVLGAVQAVSAKPVPTRWDGEEMSGGNVASAQPRGGLLQSLRKLASRRPPCGCGARQSREGRSRGPLRPASTSVTRIAMRCCCARSADEVMKSRTRAAGRVVGDADALLRAELSWLRPASRSGAR